jgi:hypothetical protein
MLRFKQKKGTRSQLREKVMEILKCNLQDLISQSNQIQDMSKFPNHLILYLMVLLGFLKPIMLALQNLLSLMIKLCPLNFMRWNHMNLTLMMCLTVLTLALNVTSKPFIEESSSMVSVMVSASLFTMETAAESTKESG